MQGDGTNPPRSGLELFLQFLLLEIIHSHALSRSDEEQRPRGVEAHRLGQALEAFERVLRLVLRERVDCYCRAGCCAGGGDRGEVVASTVPGERFGRRAEREG